MEYIQDPLFNFLKVLVLVNSGFLDPKSLQQPNTMFKSILWFFLRIWIQTIEVLKMDISLQKLFILNDHIFCFNLFAKTEK